MRHKWLPAARRVLPWAAAMAVPMSAGLRPPGVFSDAACEPRVAPPFHPY